MAAADESREFNAAIDVLRRFATVSAEPGPLALPLGPAVSVTDHDSEDGLPPGGEQHGSAGAPAATAAVIATPTGRHREPAPAQTTFANPATAAKTAAEAPDVEEIYLKYDGVVGASQDELGGRAPSDSASPGRPPIIPMTRATVVNNGRAQPGSVPSLPPLPALPGAGGKKRRWSGGSGGSKVVPAAMLISPKDIGRRVNIRGYGDGTLKFLGLLAGAPSGRPAAPSPAGSYLGVHLDNARGDTDGTGPDGARLFECPPKHGVLVPLRSGKCVLIDRAMPGARRARTAWGGAHVPGQDELSAAAAAAATRTPPPAGRAATTAAPQQVRVKPLQTPGALRRSERDVFAVSIPRPVVPPPKLTGRPKALTVQQAAQPARPSARGDGSDRGDSDDGGSKEEEDRVVRSLRAELDAALDIRPAASNGSADEDGLGASADDSDAEGAGSDADITAAPGPDDVQGSDPESNASSPTKLGNTAELIDGMNALHRATRAGNRARLARILAKGQIDIDSLDAEGRTALMYAVHFNHLDCAHLLLRQGADPDAQEPVDGSTALHDAAYKGTHLMLLLLLQSGAANLRDYDGRLPLHWATDNDDLDCLSILVSKIGRVNNINVTDSAGMTPLMWAAFHDRPKAVKKLLKYGADVDEKDIDGKTAMHWAIHDTNATLKLLLSLDATFFKDAFGKTVAHCAAENDSAKALELILKLRKDAVMDLDKNGRTPLHWAATSGAAGAVRVLLRNNADPAARDNRDACARDYVQAKRLTWVLNGEELQSLDDISRLLMQRNNLNELAQSPGGAMDWDSQSQLDTASVMSKHMEHHNRLLQARLLAARQAGQPVTPGTSSALDVISSGTWLWKFSGQGLGNARRKYFWANLATGEILWSNSHGEMNVKRASAKVLEVCAGTPKVIGERPDYDPDRDCFRFPFELHTSAKTLYLAACSAAELKAWIEGLQKVLRSRVKAPTSLPPLRANHQIPDGAATVDDPSLSTGASPRLAPRSLDPPAALLPKPRNIARAILVRESGAEGHFDGGGLDTDLGSPSSGKQSTAWREEDTAKLGGAREADTGGDDRSDNHSDVDDGEDEDALVHTPRRGPEPDVPRTLTGPALPSMFLDSGQSPESSGPAFDKPPMPNAAGTTTSAAIVAAAVESTA